MLSRRSTITPLICSALLAILNGCSDGVEPAGPGSSSSTGNAGSGGEGTGGNGGSGQGGGGNGGAGGQGGEGGAPQSMYCAPDTVTTMPNGANAFDVQTDHYDLYAEAPKEQAEEMGRMLEAAYPALQAYFEATPPLAAGERLKVRFFADEASWAAGLMADGIMVPGEAGGYYSPTNEVAYLYKQGSPYYTHVLLLHEAIHQYHFVSRVKNPNLPFWFVEGVAEYLARHDWNNRCIQLGVVPLLSWEDLPAEALSSTINLPGVVSGSVTPNRGVSWAIYRFLEHGENGAHKASFKAYRDAMDSNQPNPSFSALVGDPAALAQPLDAFVPTAQEPMKPIYIEWTHVGQRSIFADSGMFVSLAVTKADVSHFETRYDVPTGNTWSVGVVLGYNDNQNYSTLLLYQNGALQTFNATAGTITTKDVGTAPVTLGDGTGLIAVDFGAGDEVKVTVNGVNSTYTVPLQSRGGLALNSSQIFFHDIDWK